MNMIASENPVVPASDLTAGRRYYGKYAGIVISNSAQNGEDHHRGRIKVRVSGILEETPDGKASQPIEIIAAPCFLPGFFFIPENQAPVWVEFVAGDINFPIWTGVWYPTGAVPKDSSGTAPDEHAKVIRTSSGQVIHLSDASGSEQTVIKDEKNGNTVTLDSNGVTIECLAGPSGATNTLTLGSSGVTIQSLQSQATGTGSITMDSNGVTVTFGVPASTVKIGSSGIAITAAPGTPTTVSDGTGQAQGVVLGPLIQWLLTHTHIGNLGAPTPLNPAQMAQLTTQLTAGQGVVSRPGG
jgi:uncharacterized protein involved in type VI secretion and phage assembly